MSKPILFISVSLLMAGLTFFSVLQSSLINEQEQTISEQEKDIKSLGESLNSEIVANEALSLENGKLLTRIKNLTNEIDKLQKIIREQKNTIRNFQKKIREIEKKYKELKEKVTWLTKQEAVDKARILDLENQKTELRNEMTNIQRQKEETVNNTIVSEEKVMDKIIKQQKLEKLNIIINNTRVNFNSFSAHRKKFGRRIAQIKAGSKSWKHSGILFYLENNQPQLLLDETFGVKLVDTDSKKVIPYNEENPAFPTDNVGEKGIKFKYDGNLVELDYYNNEAKEGQNFEIQIFYLKDGKEYQLINGIIPVVKDGKPLSQ